MPVCPALLLLKLLENFHFLIRLDQFLASAGKLLGESFTVLVDLQHSAGQLAHIKPASDRLVEIDLSACSQLSQILNLGNALCSQICLIVQQLLILLEEFRQDLPPLISSAPPKLQQRSQPEFKSLQSITVGFLFTWPIGRSDFRHSTPLLRHLPHYWEGTADGRKSFSRVRWS